MLVGENIILRPVKKEDLELFNIWRNSIEIKNQALLHPFPVTTELDEEWFGYTANDKSNKTVFFSITDKNDKVLGYTFLNAINWINRNSYFGIIIGEKSQRGKGVGKATLELITNYAFNNLNLHKITLEVVANNIGAIKLYESFGFKQEGELKKHVFVNGKFEDIKIFSIFK